MIIRFQRLREKQYAAAIRRRCTTVGVDFKVQGPTYTVLEGRVDIGDNVIIRSRTHNQVDIHVAHGAHLAVGHRVFINQGVRISCSQYILIGDGCLIADESVILDNDYHSADGHDVKQAPIVLERNVWLATRVIVLRGVTIGEGSIIGAGSVVTRSIPAHSFAAGVPAKVLRSLDTTTG